MQPNVYLQSPSMIGTCARVRSLAFVFLTPFLVPLCASVPGARRQELRSPLVPHVVQAQAKGGGKLDAIREEASASRTRERAHHGASGPDPSTRVVRKNSI